MTRTVVGTGGGTGMGRAVAVAFVSDHATVVITGGVGTCLTPRRRNSAPHDSPVSQQLEFDV